MINKPKFKNCFQVEIVESVGVFLLSEKDSCLLSDRLYLLLAPLIDGNRTTDEMVEILQGQASETQIYYTLMLMEEKGYIVESDHSVPSEIADFCSVFSIDLQEAFRRLQETPVDVTALGQVTRQEFVSLLKLVNIQVAEEGDISLVLTDNYLQEDLEIFNQKARESKKPWMLIKPVGTTIWIGPIFVPCQTGCWECLAQRLRVNHPVETFLHKHKGRSLSLPNSFASLASIRQTALSMAATETAKWIINRENSQLQGKIITFDTLSLEMRTHVLVQRPQCPCCGESQYWSGRQASPLVLKTGQKSLAAEGGYRCLPPEETIKRYQHHISPITGVIRDLRLRNHEGNSLIQSYFAEHNLASIFDRLSFSEQNWRGRSGGKGKTQIQAKVSGLCESLERYSGVFQGHEIRTKGSKKQMGNLAIHPNACMNFSEQQYQNRQQWNAKSPPKQHIPEPFDEEKEIEWTPVWSLTHQEFKYLPTAYCYYGYPSQDLFCWANSNGNAAGNTLEEAILQGFMELVERDSIALWWYNRLQKPAVNLDSFDEPYFQALQDYYHSLNREFWVLDLTSDLNIPVFAAISRRVAQKREEIIFGFGAHFNPSLAVVRALTEMNQMLTSISGLISNAKGSNPYGSGDRQIVDWLKTATVKNQTYLVPNPHITALESSSYPHLWQEDLLEDVNICLDIVKQNGMELLVLDQTHPDIGLNVVKVIVPGLRHHWRRLGSGRLYDVPVKLGWLEKSIPENNLNPLSIFC